jgi:hypothetical protein
MISDARAFIAMPDPTGRNNMLSYRPLINSSVFLINNE